MVDVLAGISARQLGANRIFFFNSIRNNRQSNIVRATLLLLKTSSIWVRSSERLRRIEEHLWDHRERVKIV
jgi:hypothetical protein